MTNSADLDQLAEACPGSAELGLIDRNLRYFTIVEVLITLNNNSKQDEMKHIKMCAILCPRV